ncbi:hemerythrin HHE cation binding domain-containing protein [Podospora conica]|nr:hemerythrin HHE cation binding domain-containing protein [Schizothecium conicum]
MLRTPLLRGTFRAPRCAPLTLLRPLSTTPSARSAITDTIKRDHRELESHYNNIMCTPDSDPDTAARWQNQFVWSLARHSIAEELVVYPAFEKHIPSGAGKAMADKDRAEHQNVKELLYKFQSLSPSSPEFKPTLERLWRVLSQHIAEEEKEDLPALEKCIDADSGEALAKSFGRTKHFVPTRSHPSAPDKPPYETAVGMMATPMDKLMDMFKKFPDEATPEPGKGKRVSGGSAEVIG